MQHKILFLAACLLLQISHVFCQQNSTVKISGTISNAQNRLITFGYDNKDGITKVDTVLLDDNGSFKYENTQIQKPTVAYLGLNTYQYNYLLLAPGFDLNLNVDMLANSIINLVNFSGIGAQINLFRKNEITYKYYPSDYLWYSKPYDSFLTEYQKVKFSHDKVISETFTPQALKEPYAQHFKKLLEKNYFYYNADYIFDHIKALKYSEEKSMSLVKELISEDFFTNLYNLENQDLPRHQSFLNSYISYFKMIDEQKEPGITKQSDYTLNRINNSYKDPFRDRAMYEVMTNTISSAKDLSRLLRADSIYQNFYPLMREPFVTKVKKYYNDKVIFFENTQGGNKAPYFLGKDPDGYEFTPESFNGKVLFIDFWASWCAPCRHETPYLKQLYDSLKGYDNFKLLSISVADRKDKWEKAIQEENFQWNNIFDENNTSQTNYFKNGDGIPKFVLINKEGKIVNFNAPKPSQAMDTLIEIIRVELER